MYNELHGWKALAFMVFLLTLLGLLAWQEVISSDVFEGVLYFLIGYAGGNTVLKKHKDDYELTKRKKDDNEELDELSDEEL